MNKLLISAYLAIIYGAGLSIFETVVNWGQWQWWPYWVIDYAAAGLLLIGGVSALKGHETGSKFLCLAWGFTLAMLWMSLAGNISDGTDPNRAARVANLYITLIVVSIIMSLIGLFLALTGKTQTP